MSKKLVWSVFVFILLVLFVLTTSGCGGGSGGSADEPEEHYDIGEPPLPPEETPEEEPEPAPDDDDEMLHPEFWVQRLGDANDLLLSFEEIEKINSSIVDSKLVSDLNFIESVEEAVFDSFGYNAFTVNGIKTPIENLFDDFKARKSQLSELRYAVTVQKAKLLDWPISYDLDTLSYPLRVFLINDIMEVNSPLVISEMYTSKEGITFYYGISEGGKGWIESENIAFFASKDDWNDAWHVSMSNKDFITVIEDVQATAGNKTVDLRIGTKLKLANPINHEDLALYLPTRDANGSYKAERIYLNSNKIFFGTFPLTQANLLTVAFNQRKNPVVYDGLHDIEIGSSLRQIFACFGFHFPNTSLSHLSYFTPHANAIDIDEVLDLKVGTVVFTDAGVVQFVGIENGIPYGLININKLVSMDSLLDNQYEIYGHLNLF